VADHQCPECGETIRELEQIRAERDAAEVEADELRLALLEAQDTR
jgi:hypothetical protein